MELVEEMVKKARLSREIGTSSSSDEDHEQDDDDRDQEEPVYYKDEL